MKSPDTQQPWEVELINLLRNKNIGFPEKGPLTRGPDITRNTGRPRNLVTLNILDSVVLKTWKKYRRKAMEQKQKTTEQEPELSSMEMGYEIPETGSMLRQLEAVHLQELKREHTEQREKDEKDEKQGKSDKKRVRTKGGEICCCGVEGCGIGPMVNRS